MKFSIETSTFSRELFKVQGIAGSKSTQPILHNALIEAHADGRVTVSATDNEITVVTSSEARVEVPGRVTIRAKDLFDTLKSGVRSEAVTLEREDEGLGVRLTAGTLKVRFNGLDPVEYPALPRIEGVNLVALPTERLMRVIDRVLPAISTDDGRPNLTGALTKLTADGSFSMVSTDGHRLSQAKTQVAAPGDDIGKLTSGVIVPRKGLAELRRTVEATEPLVSLGVKGTSIAFEYGNTKMFVRLIDGTFPDFTAVIPVEKPERRASVSRAELLNRLKFVATFASSKTYNVRLQLEADLLTIAAHDPDKGECEERLAVAYNGRVVKAGYNYRYLLDVLTVLTCDKVSVEITDTLLPTVLHELEGEDGDDSLFIVMPMRL